MGLAVRFNVSVEDIKRSNNLWTDSDVLLRSHLLIPVPNGRSVSHSDDGYPLFSHLNGFVGEAASSSTALQQGNSNGVSGCISKHGHVANTNSVGEPSSTDDSDLSAADFLSRFDSQLLHIKGSVEKLESMSALGDEDNLSERSKPTVRYLARRSVDYVEGEAVFSYPQLQFKSTASGNKSLVSIASSFFWRGPRNEQHAFRGQDFYDL